MKLYPRLAFLSMRKNAKIYIPYLISCIGSVTMYYIIDYLSVTPTLDIIRGGTSLGAVLSLGKFVIAVFAAIFLFYTNSFIVRRRNREFGLYNVLGMDKKGIGRVVFFESSLVCAVSLTLGLFLGIALSKLAELGLLFLIRKNVNYNYSVPLSTVKYTLIIFLLIFMILLLRSLAQIKLSGALELMKSENVGEKPPKANPVAAVIGGVILIAAYIIAIRTKTPLSAIGFFMIAVIMVIAATYILFISGSVALCRALQKNKKFYYKKNHFVPVSTMAYRMKRNGAGLASICILSTMVLVMLASTASLYFGAEDSMKSRFPMENEIVVYPEGVDLINEEHRLVLEEHFEKIFEEQSVTPVKIQSFGYADITGILNSDGSVDPDASRVLNNIVVTSELRSFYFMSLADYNRNMGTSLEIDEGQAMISTIRCDYNNDCLRIGEAEIEICGKLEKFPEISIANVTVLPSVIVVTPDLSVLKPLDGLADYNGDRMLDTCISYSYDLDENDDKQIEVMDAQRDSISEVEFIRRSDGGFSVTTDCLSSQREDFYTTYGGLFFIGIILSIIFISAMAMIIYYKQISEGYEDRGRFEIMQKIGMTKEDISKSINAQTLIVFFTPLIMAGVHLCFAFQPIWKILMLFNISNLSFVIAVTAAAFVVFGIFYTVLYKITSDSYFRIVSSDKK